MSTLALPLGTRLHEYRLDAVLGAGAFAITYRGWDENLMLPVAIKEFFPADLMVRDADGAAQLAEEADAALYEWGIARFISEAQVLARFKHPNIVRVSRYFAANRTAYIVMDYEQGESLSAVLARNRDAADEAFVRGLFLPLLEGLRVVHAKRYLHRDIKPANVYLRADGSPLLLDFGAARLEFGASGADSLCALTPRYAPPEQYSPDGEQGPWSDLYALGATIYRCIAGEAPVEAPVRAGSGGPDPNRSAAEAGAGRFTGELLEAVDWCLRVDPRARPQTAGALIARLTGSTAAKTVTTTFAYQPRRAERVHKIVFSGPVGAGKTTAIESLSDTPVLRSHSGAMDPALARKDVGTVALDFGTMDLPGNEKVHLYGTPGQERCDFTWDVVRNGALGLVLLIDNSRPAPLDDLAFHLDAFADLVRPGNVAIGVTFTDRSGTPGIDDYHWFLARRDASVRVNPPVFAVDPRSRADMRTLVQALLFSLDPGVEDHDA